MNKTEALCICWLIGAGSIAAAATDVPAPAPAPAPASAADAPPAATPPKQAQIPFASKGGIWNWQVVDDKTVLIESRGRQWYKATLFGNCINLAFANGLVFIPNPSGSFDKFSSIRSRGQRCPLVSLVAIPAPLKKANPKNVVTAPAASSLTSP
jgi:hypothetical protein